MQISCSRYVSWRVLLAVNRNHSLCSYTEQHFLQIDNVSFYNSSFSFFFGLKPCEGFSWLFLIDYLKYHGSIWVRTFFGRLPYKRWWTMAEAWRMEPIENEPIAGCYLSWIPRYPSKNCFFIQKPGRVEWLQIAAQILLKYGMFCFCWIVYHVHCSTETSLFSPIIDWNIQDKKKSWNQLVPYLLNEILISVWFTNHFLISLKCCVLKSFKQMPPPNLLKSTGILSYN